MTLIQRKIQIEETAMGSGFFMFFRVKTQSMPPSSGGGSSSSSTAVRDEDIVAEIEVDQSDLDNSDVSDILTLMIMADLI